MQRLISLAVFGVLAVSCSKASDTPISCMRNGLDRMKDRLTGAQLASLCSRATDSSDPLDCFENAKAATDLNLSDYGALALCSAYSLDASNAKQAAEKAAAKSCPSVDVSDLDRRLRSIESKLEELGPKRR